MGLFSRKRRHAKAVFTFEQLRDIQNGKNISINVPPNVSVLWISCNVDKRTVEFDFKRFSGFWDEIDKMWKGFDEVLDRAAGSIAKKL